MLRIPLWGGGGKRIPLCMHIVYKNGGNVFKTILETVEKSFLTPSQNSLDDF